MQRKDLNTIALRTRGHNTVWESLVKSVKSATPSLVPTSASTSFHVSGLDRKAMEQERLARLGKRKREASPPGFELFNFREGCTDAWQLGEPVDDFVRRLPPATTSVSTCPWIWVENPHRRPCDKPATPQVEQFTSGGLDLLEASLKTRRIIEAQGSQGSKSAVIKALNQEGKDLQQRIANLATKHHVVSGKVSNI